MRRAGGQRRACPASMCAYVRAAAEACVRAACVLREGGMRAVGVCVACVWCVSAACVLWVCRGCAVRGVVGGEE